MTDCRNLPPARSDAEKRPSYHHGTLQAALIEAIRGHFDDLELDAALAGLARLRAELSGTGDGAAT